MFLSYFKIHKFILVANSWLTRRNVVNYDEILFFFFSLFWGIFDLRTIIFNRLNSFSSISLCFVFVFVTSVNLIILFAQVISSNTGSHRSPSDPNSRQLPIGFRGTDIISVLTQKKQFSYLRIVKHFSSHTKRALRFCWIAIF